MSAAATKFSARAATLVILALTGMICALFVRYWYLPTKSYLAERGEYLHQKERELDEVSALTRELPGLEARLEDALRQRDFLDSRFPGSFDAARITRALISAGSNAGVTVEEIGLVSPLERGDTGEKAGKAVAGVDAADFRVACRGAYEDVRNFVGQLKIAAPAMKIEDLSMARTADGSFECRLVVRTFADGGGAPEAR